jgi:hypothetical protein
VSHRPKPPFLPRVCPPLLLGLVAGLFAACTLTGDDFKPVRVERLPNQGGDAGSESSAAPCPAGAECCDDAPCAEGRSCRAGSCESPGDAGACRDSECLPEELLTPMPPASCEDGALDSGEADIDCGGVCAAKCRLGRQCGSDADCAEGLVCPSTSSRCSASSCEDGARNGDESDIDCGGNCPGCADGGGCNGNGDCQSGVCSAAGRCAAPSCDDDVVNGDESDVDCGGNCANCPTGRACNDERDCQSSVCGTQGCAGGVANCCQAPSCSDGVVNQGETDIDCGGSCPACPTGNACNTATDCQSGVCRAGGCAGGVARCCRAPSCTDGVANGDEPLIDCGNVACGLCAIDHACTLDAECASGLCRAGSCADRGTCTDGVLNGTETAVDCGGDRCQRCRDRLPCTLASDCINNNCFNDICISCGSGVMDGTETGVDCGGADPACRRCNPGERCLINSDCASNACFGAFCG